MSTLLIQRAAIWWDAFGKNSRNISDSLDGLAVAFSRPEKRNLLLQLPKKKQYNKTVDEYGWDLVKLCRAISSEMPEKEIIDWFILGLNFNIQNKLINKHFDSFIEVLNAAKEVEDFRNGAQRKFVPKTFNKPKPDIKSTVQNASVNSIEKKKPKKCFHCGKEGHLKKNCFDLKNGLNANKNSKKWN